MHTMTLSTIVHYKIVYSHIDWQYWELTGTQQYHLINPFDCRGTLSTRRRYDHHPFDAATDEDTRRAIVASTVFAVGVLFIMGCILTGITAAVLALSGIFDWTQALVFMAILISCLGVATLLVFYTSEYIGICPVLTLRTHDGVWYRAMPFDAEVNAHSAHFGMSNSVVCWVVCYARWKIQILILSYCDFKE